MNWCGILANLTVFIGGGASAYFYIAKNYVAYEKTLDDQLRGNWSSDPEGCIDCAQTDAPIVKIEMATKKNQILGVFDVSAQVPDKPSFQKVGKGGYDVNQFLRLQLCCLSLVGTRHGRKADIDVVDMIGGKYTLLGRGNIWFDGPNMKWKLTEVHYAPYAAYLPREADLYNWDKVDDFSSEGLTKPTESESSSLSALTSPK